MIPKIDIQYSHYLDGIFKAWIWSDPRYKDWVSPSLVYVKGKTALFGKTWDRVGYKIIDDICNNTGLKFKRNYFPVFVVSGNSRAFSNPIVIKSQFSPAEFVDTVTHELVHCLFVDNANSTFVQKIDNYIDHVVLYAVMESVLPGTVNKIMNVKDFSVNDKYSMAMSYVKANGYDDILTKCKGV